ncbi:DUF262 domain-containing protein [Sungkyunkwania multivorans]|uniref:DUF262 domain-containing protein n=1 Tax=Sungkyunkwania multivorans TaxID=1173618 RepID=A0ABW3CZ05_9FLAO
MINANKEKLQSFYQGNLQYEIPFFQRAYVWSEENWTIFWEHLLSELEAYEKGDNSEHFIGTIITKQKESRNLSENVVELIDGQQRLTTISIFLKALADTVSGELPNLKNSLENLLWFEDSYGKRHYRMRHSRIDAPNFLKAMETPETITDEDSSSILQAYSYFLKRLKDINDQKREKLKQVLLHKIPVISMLLDKNDDEQEIFDTINSLGVRLTIGELLKNYMFKESSLIELYDSKWLAIFENDEEQVDYWSTERSSGRVKRDNMELLLYCFLIIETKKEIRLDRLFKEYKLYLKDKTVEEKKDFLLRLSNLANIYSKMPQEKELVEIKFSDSEKRFFHLLENLEITTIFPLVLYLYKNITDQQDLLKAFALLESYLALRQICKFTTKNYNNLFIQIIRALEKPIDKEGPTSVDISSTHLREILASFTEFGNRFPTELEIKEAFKGSVLSNKQAGELLFIIALKDLDSEYSDSKTLSSKSFSVEHMMPKKWEENWGEPDFDELAKYKRKQKLLTLGNLTLITKNLNSKLRNQAWEDKKKTLKEYSSLKMTTAFLDKEQWNEDTIEERANLLATKAIDIWTW